MSVSPFCTELALAEIFAADADIYLLASSKLMRVRVLFCERDARLPIPGGPYYPWAELKKYCESLYE